MKSKIGMKSVVVALLVTAGCNALRKNPGEDFAVRVLDDLPIKVVGQIYAPVHFSVDGCGDFDLALEDASGANQSLTFTKNVDGTYVASVPIAWILKPAGLCLFGEIVPPRNEQDSGTLVTTCRDDGRSASATFSVNPQIAGGESWGGSPVRAIFALGGATGTIETSDYGGGVYIVLDGWVREVQSEWVPALGSGAYLNPLAQPRMVKRGDHVFATLGCEIPSCSQVSIGSDESLPEELLADIGITRNEGRGPPRGIAHVSANVVDMAFADDGALVVVSDTSIHPSLADRVVTDKNARWGETIVWRVIPAPEGSQGVVEDEVAVIARLPHESVATRLSRTAGGPLAFATIANPGDDPLYVSVRLHVTDGSTVTTSYTTESTPINTGFNWLVDPAYFNPGVHLSPDGSTMIMTTDPSDQQLVWLNTDPADRVLQYFGSTWLGAPPWYRPIVNQSLSNGGAAWPTGALALWMGGSIRFPGIIESASLVQVYDAAPPHSFRYEYDVEALPGATTTPMLVDLIAVGDHLVLTTTTGVRILDASGQLVGGMDPLPCGAITTAPAVQIGPTRVFVGAGATEFAFDVPP